MNVMNTISTSVYTVSLDLLKICVCAMRFVIAYRHNAHMTTQFGEFWMSFETLNTKSLCCKFRKLSAEDMVWNCCISRAHENISVCSVSPIFSDLLLQVAASSQSPHHVLEHLCAQCLMCSGPENNMSDTSDNTLNQEYFKHGE